MKQTLGPMSAVQPLMHASTRLTMEISFVSVNSVERVLDEKRVGTCNLLLTFQFLYPTVWQQLVRGLGVPEETVIQALKSHHPTKEPVRYKELSDENKLGLRFGDRLKFWGRPVPWSATVTDINKQCQEEGKATRKLVSEIRVIELMVERDCEARQALLGFADESRLRNIVASLQESPDVPSLQSVMMGNMRHDTAAMGHSLPEGSFPDEEPTRLPKPDPDATFPEHPKQEPQALTGEEIEFDRHLEHWFGLARAEAEARNAPEITLDHLFLRLIKNGTETSRFLDSKGVDCERWAFGIDTLLPRYPHPPERLGLARSFSGAIPGDEIPQSYSELMKEMTESRGLSDEERTKKMMEEIRAEKERRPFSDLLWLESEPHVDNSLTWALLKQHGIYEGEVRHSQ